MDKETCQSFTSKPFIHMLEERISLPLSLSLSLLFLSPLKSLFDENCSQEKLKSSDFYLCSQDCITVVLFGHSADVFI